jgi:hypothetical protein
MNQLPSKSWSCDTLLEGVNILKQEQLSDKEPDSLEIHEQIAALKANVFQSPDTQQISPLHSHPTPCIYDFIFSQAA